MPDAILRLRALALVALLVPLAAFGQAWPTKPVRLISPFAAGGGTDAFARPLAQVLSQNLGQQFIVDNRAGAGGTVGADIAAKARPTATRSSSARCTTRSP
jgi:tripartite-type tricarboxylate transporter receptor subunit TctC